MAQAQPESMFDPSIQDTAEQQYFSTNPGNAHEQQVPQPGTTGLAEDLSSLVFGDAEAAGALGAQQDEQQQVVEGYFDQLQDIIDKDEYSTSSTVTHVAHAARRKHADLSHTEKISQTQVHVESGTPEHITTHDILHSDAVLKAETPAFSLTGHVSDTQLQFGSVDVSSIPAFYPAAQRIPDEDAAFFPPLPGAGGEQIATTADWIPDNSAASSQLLSGARGGVDIRGNVAPDVPAGAMENGAFHGEAIDADLTYPVTPEGISADEELELQRNIVLDAIQASYVDPSFAYPEPGERDAVAPIEGTKSISVDPGEALPGTDVFYTVPGTAYPQGGNYVLTKDTAPFADTDLANMTMANLAAAEADEEVEGYGEKSPHLAEGDFALGGGHDLQGTYRPGTFGAGPREMVDLKHLDEHLSKQQESIEIDQFLNKQEEVRNVDDLLADKPETRQTEESDKHLPTTDVGTGNIRPGDLAEKDEDERPMVGALDDTRFAGAEETLPTEPAMSSATDVDLHVGPSSEQGREIADTLEKAGIIPDVLDKFISTTRMNIFYKEGAPLKNGSKLNEHEVANQPEIVIEGAFVMPGSTYAVALVDVDAKRAVDGERLERLLWLQIGIPGPQDMGSTGMVARGTNLVEYEAPTSKSDLVHRYLYVLFKHKNSKFKVPADREAFSCRLFASVHHLMPIAAINFTVENAS